MDFEVGDRSEKPLLRLLERLPGTARIYETDAYGVVPVAAQKPAQGGEVRRSELE